LGLLEGHVAEQARSFPWTYEVVVRDLVML
jgi:hypothetical protein